MKTEKINSSSVKRSSVTTRLLILYDIVFFIIVEALILGLYRGDDSLSRHGVLCQATISFASVFSFRFFSKVYNQIWRYGGIQSYIRLLFSDLLAGIVYLVSERLLPIEHISFARLLSVCCVNLLFALSMRMLYRYTYKCCQRDSKIGRVLNTLLKIISFGKVELEKAPIQKKIKIAIIGAGRVGVSLAEELLNSKTSAYIPRLFIDVNEEKIGKEIFNLPVFYEVDVTDRLLNEYEIQEVVLALPQATAQEKKRLYELYKAFGCKVKVYDFPTMEQATDGTKRFLREFDIEELLFRKPLIVTNDKTSAFYSGKTVLITGGGGSIGSELSRQIAKMNPKKLILLDVYENGVYDVQQELKIAYGNNLDISVEILSVCNIPALEKVFSVYKPNVVLHAAAHKHVPLMEHNAVEAVENNVFGTLNCVTMAEKYGVERFMMVSTDKAVNPTNVMGATKRMCEMIVMCHAGLNGKTTFSATRFGNVLGSAGSVIPLFKRQIANGGPLTLTDFRIIRYFMTIPEASQLVLQSGSMAKNGELFVLDMGRPVKILDLAENMIRLSGYEPYTDIDIIETGLRPGEKLFEELLVKTETLSKTDNDLIFIEKDIPITQQQLSQKLELLAKAVASRDDEAARLALHKAVPTFLTPEQVNAQALKSQEMKAVN